MTPKSQAQRQRVWRHNSFIGSAVMMQKQARAIANSDSASEDAKHTASNIFMWATTLEAQLRKARIDP